MGTNRLTANPIYFENFNTDTVLATGSVTVTKIRWKGVSTNDVLKIEDRKGNVVFEDISTSGTDWQETSFGAEGQRFDGIQIDEDQCTNMDADDGTDALYIYLK